MVECRYCQNKMIEVVRGWHCPVCHATLGREPAVADADRE